MAYTSIIDDIEIVQDTSSPIWFIGHPDGRQLDDGNWQAQFKIMLNFGDTPIVTRTLSVNSGTGEGDNHTAGTKFVFQILRGDSDILDAGKKYAVVVEIWNDSINFSQEVARFKCKVLQGS